MLTATDSEAFDLAWIPMGPDNRTLPASALAAGCTAREGSPGGGEAETLYVGRAEYEGYVIPGKVHFSHGAVYFPFGGAEEAEEEYEMLVLAQPAGALVEG